MSVPLNEQRRSELPLIAFTTCEPAALGVALFGFTALLADGPSGAPALSGLLSGDSVLGASGALAAGALPALIAWTLCSIGMLASIGHLAKPLRAPRSLANLRSSWLSREILLVGAFWVVLTAWVAASLAGSEQRRCCLRRWDACSARSSCMSLRALTRYPRDLRGVAPRG